MEYILMFLPLCILVAIYFIVSASYKRLNQRTAEIIQAVDNLARKIDELSESANRT
ncbi:MAG: hypothetical protein LBT22_06845 [Peptococcaceae bacterium]|jgi:hypothetical protein|nr:hypothetical protein [Peptococcaceae bacterium]